VSPGLSPASVSARRTQIRNISWLMLNFAEIEQIAFHCHGYSPWCLLRLRRCYGEPGRLVRTRWARLARLEMWSLR
jgi:hypothetical protein